MVAQDSNLISDDIIQARVNVASEIFAGVLNATKDSLERSFKKPQSYYDGEKKNVIAIAKMLFEHCVTPEDINRIAEETILPEIIPATLEAFGEIDGDDASEECLGSNSVGF